MHWHKYYIIPLHSLQSYYVVEQGISSLCIYRFNLITCINELNYASGFQHAQSTTITTMIPHNKSITLHISLLGSTICSTATLLCPFLSPSRVIVTEEFESNCTIMLKCFFIKDKISSFPLNPNHATYNPSSPLPQHTQRWKRMVIINAL